MNYKSMMGYGKKKKKIVKESSKPKKNKILESVKKEFGYPINEWHHQPKTAKRWSKSIKSYEKSGLTEFEKQGGKDTLKEVGAAPQYKKFVKSIDKERNKVGKQTLQFVDLLRKKGLGDAADDLLDSYKNNVIKFGLEVKKIMRKII